MKLITAIICAASLFAGAVAAEAQPNCKLRPDQVLKLYPEGQAAGKGLPETQGPVTSNGNTAEMESIAENGNISYMGDNARMELGPLCRRLDACKRHHRVRRGVQNA